eukprot:jgi/Tetstr1/429759/TSEL_001935.t1
MFFASGLTCVSCRMRGVHVDEYNIALQVYRKKGRAGRRGPDDLRVLLLPVSEHPRIAHLLHHFINDSFTLSKIMNKVKYCITWTKKSSKGWHVPVLACREMRLKVVKFITPAKTRFTSDKSDEEGDLELPPTTGRVLTAPERLVNHGTVERGAAYCLPCLAKAEAVNITDVDGGQPTGMFYRAPAAARALPPQGSQTVGSPGVPMGR